MKNDREAKFLNACINGIQFRRIHGHISHPRVEHDTAEIQIRDETIEFAEGGSFILPRQCREPDEAVRMCVGDFRKVIIAHSCSLCAEFRVKGLRTGHVDA